MFFQKPKRFEESAFTFLEVVIVVFIVSVLAAVVLPSLFGSSVSGHDDDARMVASILRFAQDRALFTMNEVSVDVDLDRKTISFEREGKEEVRKISSLHAVKVTSSKKKLSGTVTVVFPDSGLMERITVRLSADSGYLDVICNPYSGKVTIERAVEEDLDKTGKS